MSNHTKQRDTRRHKFTERNYHRPKTFKTEESAKAWAEKQGIVNYKIVNLKYENASIKKLKVVAV